MSSEILDDIRLYLPKYLSDEQQQQLFQELSSFPENIDKRFYSFSNKEDLMLYQGDGFLSVLMPKYDDQTFREVKGFLVSNSCDASLENANFYSSNIVFAPIVSLTKWEEVLRTEHEGSSVSDHIEALKRQRLSSFFYLPNWGHGGEDCFARFDKLFSFPLTREIAGELIGKRVFSLSNYGFYLLLLKLSIHFSRVQENINRDVA